ncbi:MAG: hypothetical protein PVF22_01945 [Candidatus Aminicenantes bacterium]|jgi:hypothetical protein
MKKKAVFSIAVLISILCVSQGLLAQRYYRTNPGIEGDSYELNLTRQQMETIEKLELELEKELDLLFVQLRTHYRELDELEAQRIPDPAEIEKIMDKIYKLEADIRNREMVYENKIRGLLTEDQKALLNSYYAGDRVFYGMGGFGRGYFGRGYGRFGYGGYGYGAGRLGRGYSGYYGISLNRSYRGRRGFFGPGTLRLSYGRYSPLRGVRYGRGPCGAGLGRLSWWRYSRGPWKWNR